MIEKQVLRFRKVFHCIVKPNSKTEQIIVNNDCSLRIKINSQPIKGKANTRLIEFLSETFNLPKANIQLLSGFNSTYKNILIEADENYLNVILGKYKK